MYSVSRILVFVISVGMVGGALADTVTIGASKDNTLYERATGDRSNGAGQYFFAGRSADTDLKRGLIEFDVAGAVPAGSTITDVTLSLHMSRTDVGSRSVGLHTVLSDWGEAGSDASGNEGAGAAPRSGDATWLHTFYSTHFWNSAGGDFSALSSASISVSGIGTYSWTSANMIADVQTWLNIPDLNYGWLLLGNETTQSTKRFDTREHPTASFRPALTIEFEPPLCEGDLDGDNDIDLADLAQLLSNYGTTGGAVYEDGDLDGDGDVDLSDLAALLAVYGMSC